jgi:1-phosphofructokinase/tagatose 6-phosphate kinase
MKIAITSLNPAIERLLVVEHNEPGAVHRLRLSETLAGGKGVNVARVVRQLGTPEFAPVPPAYTASGARPGRIVPLLFGPLGGPTGELQAALLTDEHLPSVSVPIAGWTRINEVLIDESRPEHATVYNAAGPELDPEERHHLDELARDAVDGAAFLVCTGSLPPGTSPGIYGEWIAAARARGIRSLLDAHGDALAFGAAAAPHVVKVNRDELHELADSLNRADHKLVSGWLDAGTEAVIVTDGPAPVLAHTAHGVFEVDSPRVPTRSAVGSGDAFTAGLVWSLVSPPEDDWPAHLTLAAACGASNAAGTLARLSADLPPASLMTEVVVRERTS